MVPYFCSLERYNASAYVDMSSDKALLLAGGPDVARIIEAIEHLYDSEKEKRPKKKACAIMAGNMN